jgi:hypothetical protein
VAALALGHPVYEIDQRWWELQEVFDVLDADDACITAELENMVASGELRPHLGVGGLESLISATGKLAAFVTHSRFLESQADLAGCGAT